MILRDKGVYYLSCMAIFRTLMKGINQGIKRGLADILYFDQSDFPLDHWCLQKTVKKAL